MSVARPVVEREQPAPAPIAAGPGFLVWTGPSAPNQPFVTHWLVPDGGKLKEVGQVDGIVVSANGAPWKLVEHKVEIETYTCDSINVGAPEVGGKGSSTGLIAERLTDHRKVEVVGTRPAVDTAAEFEHGAQVRASIGPYLFVQESQYDYSCGAHGGVAVNFQVFDLTLGADTEILDSVEREKLRERELGQALEAFRMGEAGEPVEKTESELSLAMYQPRFEDQREKIGFDYVYVTDACYACTSGEWGSYSQTVTVQSPRVPNALAAWESTPAELEEWVAKANTTIGGWSALDGNENETAALVSVMRIR